MNQEEGQKIEEKQEVSIAQLGYDTNRIMGVAAIFISILSLFAVIYQSYLAREENELIRIQQSAMVLPYLENWYSDVEGEYKYVVENKGVGPAFLKEAQFIGFDLENKDSLDFNSIHRLFRFLEQQSPLLDTVRVVKSSLRANMLLPPGEKREYFIFSFDNRDQLKEINNEMKKYFLGFKIVYEDVYGTAWMLDSSKGYPVKLARD